MSMVETDIVEAFESLGVEPKVAIKAAQAFNRSDNNRLGRIEHRLDGIDSRLVSLEGSIGALKWGIGIIIPAVLAILLKLFLH